MLIDDGQVSLGNWINGVLEGKGRIILPNLDYFEGNFVDGNIHGKGVYFSNLNGYHYTGDFEKGYR